MGFRLTTIVRATRILTGRSESANVPKGYLAIYVGETEKKRFVIPVSYLNQPGFQDLLGQAEQEFGYNHPMGGLTIQCTADHFCDVVANLLEWVITH